MQRSFLRRSSLLLLGCWATTIRTSASAADTTAVVIPKIVTPAIDANRLAEEQAAEGRNIDVVEAPMFAIAFDSQAYSPDTNHGVWKETDDTGGNVWQLIIECPGAVHVNLGFSMYRMPDGGSLIISTNSDETNPYTTVFTSSDNNVVHGELWTPVYFGTTVTLTVVLPPNVPISDLQLILSTINAGFRGFGATNVVPLAAKSGACNVDVVCAEEYDDWRNEISSVAAYSRGGTRICTGALINTVENDETPYFLTAYHCVSSNTTARSLVVYWNYETNPCGQTPPNGNLNQFQRGATMVAGWSETDFSLLLLDNKPNTTWNIQYAGWDRSGTNLSQAIAIHHPQGEEKRISYEHNSTSITDYTSNTVSTTGNHIRVADWDRGTTEPGSSGSPLFDIHHRIVGQLHGGNAACGNDKPDWYGGFFQSWEGNGSPTSRLKDWLDPNDTQTITVNTTGQPIISIPHKKNECPIFLWPICFIIDLIVATFDFVVGLF